MEKENPLKEYRLLCSILIGLLLVSCTASPTLSSVPAKPPPGEASQIPSGNSSGNSALPLNTPDFSEVTPLPAEANAFIRLTEEDLAHRLHINANQIRFLKISDIDWQDITQGCTTETSQTSTKGRLSGYRIWLEANGKDNLYHIGLDNKIDFCSS